MTLIGWVLGLLLGLMMGWVVLRLQGRWAGVAAGLGWLALAGLLGAVLVADSFSQGFVLIYLTAGAALSLLAALPRLLLRDRRAAGPEALWVSLGLGTALVAWVLLAGLGTDALLTALLPTAKAQASFGLVPGLLLGTVLGLGWGWVRARRSPAALP